MTHDDDRYKVAKLWLEGVSDNKIHQETGVARTTIKAWRDDSEVFAVTVDAIRSDILREQAGQANPAIKAAWKVLTRALEGREEDQSKIRVAQQLLDKTGALLAAGRQLGLEQVNHGKSTGVAIQVNVNGSEQTAKKRIADAKDVSVTTYDSVPNTEPQP